MCDRTLDHKTTLTLAACILVALTLLVAAFWGQAVLRGRTLVEFVETGAVWTRFDLPVLEQVKEPDSWKVPALFTYQVGARDFSGREMMYESICDARKPQIGQAFRVWYDPLNPDDHHFYARSKLRDAHRLVWVSAVLGAICMVASWLSWRR